MGIAEAELFSGFDRFALTVSPDDEPGVVAGVCAGLRVRVDVRSGTRAWSEEDACLTLTEARQLVEWMQQQAGAPAEDRTSSCRFTESSLSFVRDAAEVIVTLDLELTPLGWEGPCEVRLPFDAGQAREFARALTEQLDHLGDETDAPDGPLIPVPPRFRNPAG